MYPRPIKSKQPLTIAVAGLAAACLLGAATAPRAPAQSAVDNLNALQSKLDDVEGKEAVTTQTISRYNDRIGSLQDQVVVLQRKRAEVQARLVAVQTELDEATARLTVLREHLDRAIELLSQRLIEIYKGGEPDTLTVLLDANGFDELVETGPYLQRINGMDASVVDRVRSLRDQVQTTVDQVTAARDEIASRKAELDRTAADLSARKSQLATARSEQRQTLDRLKGQQKDLEGDLSEASKEVAKELGTYSSPLPAGAITPGQAGFIWPINGPITSPFGPRWGSMHEGVDISAPSGTPIRAAKAGRIVIAAPTGGYGNYTCIDHGGGLSTCYAHQSSFALTGGSLAQGQILGYVGSTGHSTGPHLHFEVRINGTAVDPLGYL